MKGNRKGRRKVKHCHEETISQVQNGEDSTGPLTLFLQETNVMGRGGGQEKQGGEEDFPRLEETSET